MSAAAHIERERWRTLRETEFENLTMLDFGCCKIERIQSGEARFLTKETDGVERSPIKDVFTKGFTKGKR